jgi:hypothetical protein
MITARLGWCERDGETEKAGMMMQSEQKIGKGETRQTRGWSWQTIVSFGRCV